MPATIDAPDPATLGVPLGFSPDSIPSDERRAATTRFLRDAAFLQIEILTLAIQTRRPFEKWAGLLLNRHWQQALLRWQKGLPPAPGGGRKSSIAPEKFKWNKTVACQRTSDLYMTKGEEGPARRNTKLSVRACHLETWICRYLASSYPQPRRQTGVRALAEAAGITGPAADFLTERLLLGSEQESSDYDPAAIADGLYNLLDWNYIARAVEFCDEPERRTAKTYCRKVLDLFDAVIRLTRPGALKITKAWHDSIRVHRVHIPLDDLIDTASIATSHAAARYNYHTDYTFTGIAKAAINSHLRRAVVDERCIRIPEETAMALHKHSRWKRQWLLDHPGEALPPLEGQLRLAGVRREYNQWRQQWMQEHAGEALPPLERQLELAGVSEPLGVWRALWVIDHPDTPLPPLEGQMELAGVEGSARPFAEALQTANSTRTLSLQALTEDADHRENFANEVLLSDGGAGARQVRGDHDNPGLVRLRRVFRQLPPLYQGALNCLAPCAVTDDGDLAWTDHVIEMAEAVIKSAAARARRGVETRVAAGIVISHT
ncbi:MAG: hypothetical protein PHE83_17215 [Opitutaceae bacterium]|nr:hypothetical protein [Opitutaceae bacterium]